jgi:hypothetical protein
VKSPSSVPERILVTGQAGSGKSECAARVADQLRVSESPAKVRWINCDTRGTVERVNERWDDWDSNIEHIDAHDWASLRTATDLFLMQAKPDDWLIIDSMERAWEWVRDAYVDQRERKAGRIPDFSSDPFATVNDDISGPEYNTQINPAYARWIMPILNECPAHLLLTSPAQPIRIAQGERGWGDDKQIIEEFGRFGVRPSGQKNLLFQVHTALLTKHTAQGYTVTSMKDRSRELLTDASMALGFPTVYLASVAGWSL